MHAPVTIKFEETDVARAATLPGRLAVFAGTDGKLDPVARRVDRLTRGAVARAAASAAFGKLKPGEGLELGFPAGLTAEAVQVIRLDRRSSRREARLAGATIARLKDRKPVTVLAGALPRAEEIAFGLALRAYSFDDHRGTAPAPEGEVTVMVSKPEEVARRAGAQAALAEAVFFTRDLVWAPANVLTTTEFAAKLAAMQELGLDVEIYEEPEIRDLGMRLLMSVGQGSESPSKVVVMRWLGGGEAAPVKLIGKGVVFDTGGISLKPAQGMEEMTMDMGGAGVVAGVMRALAMRKAKANVIGMVGLVENMPSGSATRPGDVVKSMKGDTVEIINTDAEGRLVLADLLWYAQEDPKPAAVIDLATLTGAVVIALGHEKAGVFSNNDSLASDFLAAAEAEGEGAWRLPLDAAYDPLLKSDIADMKNVGGRPAGSVTAAMFLQRFIREGTPWMHLDIAGVARTPGDTAFAPKGATGWGVLALDRLIRDRYEV